jgi:hypothetical protein
MYQAGRWYVRPTGKWAEGVSLREVEMKYAILIALLCGMYASTVAASPRQTALSCPLEAELYCGGWTITVFSFEREPGDGGADDHIKVGHRFVIGEKDDNLWLFPRGELMEGDRWGRRVKLEFAGGESDSCLVGEVFLARGHAAAHAGGQGARHRIVLKPSVGTTELEIGPERQLVLLIFDQPVDETSPCEPPDDGMRHAGEAHAED